ncbi:N,N-dimethylformamidase beta subunit family domain-containing protein [Parahaliea mediterranea]|uniref:N,N-dimethylformamidase beta subunit-like C-terminal domain-containing protein n=1 Tax=Parahaliea mediterranea TaxID=651086 RepID=A0A939DIR6_9GAMM|nr:N,N-dimethylformamidase beta subunit family domain-containing protein [Parahaliea mediterranea]MBN7799054.1 hypothetical protein [Parahaliea mediterranea]
MKRRTVLGGIGGLVACSALGTSSSTLQGLEQNKESRMKAPQFYPDKVCAFPGDEVAVHASYNGDSCRLVITRVAAKEEHVATLEGLAIDAHATAPDAGRDGCQWPRAFSFTVGSDWLPGYYDLKLEGRDGEYTRHFICVKRALDASAASAVLVLSTSTYQAYNYWGGANAYAHVEKLLSGELSPEDARDQALGVLSLNRPYAQGMFAPPPGMPRLISIAPRDFGEPGVLGDMDWFAKHQPTPYDGSAGYLGKWEHKFAAWCERNGYDIDYLTDHDFETGEDVLSRYGTVILAGHSEYWSGRQRDSLDAYVEAGGHLAVFSGNTGYWKVRWESDATRLVCHKWKGEENDPLFSDPSGKRDATHLWSHPAFGRSEAEVTGLSFLYGGYHRLGMCVARGAAAYTVYHDKHWALDGTDLFYGDQIGGDVPLIGYENDGCPIRFGKDGLPKPDGGIGIPDNLEIIAMAPATPFEPPENPFPFMIPPEKPDILARVAYGEANSDTRARLARGHVVMASFEKGRGEVFNGGTTEWAHGLAAGNPYIEKITHNVLARFGVVRQPV